MLQNAAEGASGAPVVMLPNCPPPHHGFFLAPGRVREDPTAPVYALEAFVVDETVYPFEDRSQCFRELEIETELLRLGVDFEDN
jgi:hypothetical protein